MTEREKSVVLATLDVAAAGAAVCAVVRDAEGAVGGLRVEHLNETARRRLGAAAGEVIGATIPEALPALEGSELLASLCRCAQTGEPVELRRVAYAGAGPGGILVDSAFDVRAAMLDGALVVSWADAGTAVRDAARRARHADEIGRVYTLLSAASEAIVRIRDESALYAEICALAVDLAGLRLAWIGRLDDATGTVRPACWAGTGEDYVRGLRIRLDDADPSGRGPTATALRTGRAVVINDIEHEPRMAPWRDKALAHDFRSSAAFPLRVRGEVIGTLNLYAATADAFAARETRLFEQLAAEVGVAVEVLSHERARRDAEARYRELFEKAARGAYVTAPGHAAMLRDRLEWSDRITGALREGRLVVHSQPIVDLATGRVVQEELLVRMRSAEDPGRLIAAGSFLPAAERLGLMLEIDRLVLRRALALVRQGRRVQVNISAQSVGHPAIVEELVRGLADRVEDPGRLVFELTETAAIEDIETAAAFSHAVVAAGCSLALDDFGTGFGAMTYLRALPASILKIDRSFVRDLSTSEDDRAIVRTIVAIACERGLTTIGEGVEDTAALAALRELGVDLAQGYLLGRPGPVDEPGWVTPADASGGAT